MYDILIIGGGLSGLTNAIVLADAGLNVVLVEKNNYPFHRVCGEYISNEVKPFMKSIGADVEALNPANISELIVSSPYGTTLNAKLDMGGFGVSRYKLDHFLYTIAIQKGCKIVTNTQVEEITYSNPSFSTILSTGEIVTSNLVIGSYGKRSSLDRKLNRPFFHHPSPYIGVKYHIQTDFPKDKIALHNFKDGYCGMSAIEDDKYCLCYLTSRANLKNNGSIEAMENTVLKKNPFLKNVFNNSTFLYDKPEVINEISFEKKSTSENHILMSGDTAGMIAPLCGNGMAMAIHSAKILSNCIKKNYKKNSINLADITNDYTSQWEKEFSKRLYIGKKIQHLFGRPILTEMVIQTVKHIPPLKNWLIKQTHGSYL